jgi:predicted nucleic acid-binding protein
MALSYLVDTSVLTRLSAPRVRAAIEPRIRRGELARTSITDLEVCYSARNAREWDALAKSLAALELVDTSAEHVRRALAVQRLLAARHQRGRKLPDLLVAAAAELSGLTVIHYDADFDRIAAVTGQNCEWVVRSGTID